MTEQRIKIITLGRLDFDGRPIDDIIRDLVKAIDKVKKVGGSNPYLEKYNFDIVVRYTRTETSEEIERRVKKNQRARTKALEQKEKRIEEELQLLKRLAKKYPKEVTED